jgi:predicted RNA binding protein YcfA (HicA-like mRNA interferase family)
MSKVPRVTGDQAIRAFCKAGYRDERQRGSHHILRHPSKPGLTIPVHRGRTLGVGLLASKIKDAEMTVAEFEALL